MRQVKTTSPRKRRSYRFFIGILGLGGVAVVLLLWYWRVWPAVEVAADVTITNRREAVPQLRRLLKERPRQVEFAVRWRNTTESRPRWSVVRYNRQTKTLVYTPTYPPNRRPTVVFVARPPFIIRSTVVSSGCPAEPTCNRVPASAILSSKDADGIEDIMNRAGCQSQTRCMLSA